MTQKALILAAGSGRRLRPYTNDVPKPLVTVGESPLIVRLVHQLVDQGIQQFVVVLGDRGDMIQEKLTATFDVPFLFVTNHIFHETNNSYSLWLAREELLSGCFLIEGDVIADEQVISSLVRTDLDCCWAVRPFSAGMDGAFLEGQPGHRLQRLTIVRNSGMEHESGFKSMGMLKLSPQFGHDLKHWLEDEETSNRRDRYYDLVIADRLQEASPNLFVIPDGDWMEIDSPSDLEKARALFVKNS